MRYFEDFTPGHSFDCGAVTISKEELIAFARLYDPQPMHLDEEAARTTPLGGLALSGWHGCSLAMRHYYEAVLKDSASLGGPAVNDLRWRAPMRPDAPIFFTLNVLATRASRSRPEIGFVTLELIAEQSGQIVMRFDFPAMIRRRDAEGVALTPPDRTRPAEQNPLEGLSPFTEMHRGAVQDTPVDQIFDLGEVVFDAESIVAFARDYDPQPFHVDEEAGRASLFGGLAASGWHVCSIWMRQMAAGMQGWIAAAPKEQAPALTRRFGPSPGQEKIEWLLPTLAGDRLHFYMQPIGYEPPLEGKSYGRLILQSGAVNQFGAVVFSMKSRVLMLTD